MSAVKTVKVSYAASFLSACDTHVYAYNNTQLYIYNYDLVLLKTVGQQNNPTSPFYLPTGIKQFEVNKGKIYWLNNTNLQIVKQDNGELVKSVTVTAKNFIIDFDDNIVLVNNATKEINRFTADGTLVDQMAIENYTAGLCLSLAKDGEPLFYSYTSLFVNN